MTWLRRTLGWIALGIGGVPPAALLSALRHLFRGALTIVDIVRVVHARAVFDPVMRHLLDRWDSVAGVDTYRGGSPDQILRKWNLSSSAEEQERLWDLDNDEE